MINHSLNLNSEIEGWWCVIHNHQVFVSQPSLHLPCGSFNDLNLPFNTPEKIHEIGEFEGTPVFMFSIEEEEYEPLAEEFVGLRQMLFNQENMFEFAARAFQVDHFLDTHKYCGRCGNEMTIVDWELAVHCNDCNHRCYPRISPCIIVAIRKGRQILLAKGKRSTSGLFSVLAGFVESGETLEQAVHREVFEEVGVKVKNLKYFSSQPWPFPHSLMAGFLAEHDGGEINMCEKEISAADWFDINELPQTPSKQSISGQLIARTKDMIKRQYPEKKKPL